MSYNFWDLRLVGIDILGRTSPKNTSSGYNSTAQSKRGSSGGGIGVPIINNMFVGGVID